MNLAVLVLAAGRGTRMKSRMPKVMHALCGKPMLEWSLDVARALTPAPPVIIVGPDHDILRERFADSGHFCLQPEPKGTGDAVIWAREAIPASADQILVLYGDMPLLQTHTVRKLIETHARGSAPAVALLTVDRPEAQGFGRIVRNEKGEFQRIVEEQYCTPEELRLTELNAGVYVFDPGWLFQQVTTLPMHDNGERYLTDLPGQAQQQGLTVVTAPAAPEEVLGVNDRVLLAQGAALMRARINRQHMQNGVTMEDPTTTFIEATVKIGADTVIGPGTHLTGDTHIGTDCEIGPHAHLHDSQVAAGCRIRYSVLEGCQIGPRCQIGPFGRIRSGTRLGPDVYMGSFGEVKNSVLGTHVHMGHFSYVGDAEVGANANIAAGTITCNFDGRTKHATVIGEDVFLGSGTKLVAPVQIGRGAQTGAGSVVTRDVPEGTLVYGVPAKSPHPKPAPDSSDDSS